MNAMIWREYRTLIASPLSLVVHLATPLFLPMLFAMVLSTQFTSLLFAGRSVSYLQFFVPGVAGYITFMTFQMALTFVRHDRASGMLGILILAQTTPSRYQLGKSLAQCVINVLKAAVVVGLGILLAPAGVMLAAPLNGLLFLVALVTGTVVWVNLGIALAVMLSRDDLRELIVMLISMPLVFASSMYYDISAAPIGIRAIALLNPLTYTCNVLRSAYLGDTAGFANGDLYILLLMAVAAIFLCRWIMQKAEY